MAFRGASTWSIWLPRTMRSKRLPVGVVGTLQFTARALAAAVAAKVQVVPPFVLVSRVKEVVPAEASHRTDSVEPGTTASPPTG